MLFKYKTRTKNLSFIKRNISYVLYTSTSCLNLRQIQPSTHIYGNKRWNDHLIVIIYCFLILFTIMEVFFLGVSLIFPWFFSFFKVKISSVSLCVMYTFIPLDNYYQWHDKRNINGLIIRVLDWFSKHFNIDHPL